jgi:hypothetical protein
MSSEAQECEKACGDCHYDGSCCGYCQVCEDLAELENEETWEWDPDY